MTTGTPGLAEHREQRLVAMFVELADTLVEDFDVVELLATLTERIVEIGLATQAGILLVDEAGTLRFVAASNEQTHLLELFQLQSRDGPCQDGFRTGVPVAVPQLAAERDRWPWFAPKALSTGFVAVDAVPLRLRDSVLGALNLFHAQPASLDEDSLAVAQALADVATIGIVQQRALHRAHLVEVQLQHALHSRITIEQAKGIIFEQASVSMWDAFTLLRTYSRYTDVKLIEVARRIVDGTLSAHDLTSQR